MDFIQQSFGGGMNLSVDDTRVPENAYRLAFNVRNRHDSLEAVKRSKVYDTDLLFPAIANPGGYTSTDPKVQGIIFVDPYFFIFVDGICLKKSKDAETLTVVWSTSSTHTKPAAYSNGVTTGTGTIRLSTTEEFVFTAVVPPSYDNFAAKSTSSDNPNAGAQSDYTKRIPPTVAGIVVQDGTNRPNLIEIASDTTVTARQLMGYDQWRPNFVRINNAAGYAVDPSSSTFTVDATPVQINSGAVIKFAGGGILTVNDSNSAGDTTLGGVLSGTRVEDDELGIVGFREYVPIGKHMIYHGGKLYMASSDGTKLYHSVSGRPLDFMVPLNEDGAKIHEAEAIGGVEAVSYTVSNDPITCLRSLNTEELFVGAKNSSYAIRPDITNTIFGEPTFIKKYLFSTGPVNQNSFVDLLGDFAFIDQYGIRSFNAVQQAEALARNDIFSRPISDIFKDTLQDGTFQCATIHDGYALFHLMTNLPQQEVTVVYDMATKKFVSLDTHVDAQNGIESWDGDSTTNISTRQSVLSKPIRGMASGVTTAGVQALYAVTDDPDSKGYWLKQLYGAEEYDLAIIETKSYCSQDPMIELKPLSINVLFNKPFNIFNNFKINNASGYPPGTYPTGLSSAESNYIAVDNFKEGSTALTAANFPEHNSTFFFDNGATLAFKVFAEAGTVGTLLGFSGAYATGVLSNKGVDDNAQGYNAGFFAVAQYVDDARTAGVNGGFQVKSIPLIRSGLKYPVTYPVEINTNTHANMTFNYQSSNQGWKVSFKLYLKGSPKMSTLRIQTKDVTLKSSLINQAYSA
jgi:hypothetical protein